MYNEYYTLRGLVLAEDKILTDGDKERLLKYLDDNFSLAKYVENLINNYDYGSHLFKENK